MRINYTFTIGIDKLGLVGSASLAFGVGGIRDQLSVFKLTSVKLGISNLIYM